MTHTPPVQRAPIWRGSALSTPSLVRVGEATHSQRPAAGLQVFSLLSKSAASDRAIPIATALPQQSRKCRATAQSPSTAQPQPISIEGRDSGHSSLRTWRRPSGVPPVSGTAVRAPDGLPPAEQATQKMPMAARLSTRMRALRKVGLNTRTNLPRPENALVAPSATAPSDCTQCARGPAQCRRCTSGWRLARRRRCSL